MRVVRIPYFGFIDLDSISAVGDVWIDTAHRGQVGFWVYLKLHDKPLNVYRALGHSAHFYRSPFDVPNEIHFDGHRHLIVMEDGSLVDFPSPIDGMRTRAEVRMEIDRDNLVRLWKGE